MEGEYHDESYGEQMEAQNGPYDNNEPPMLCAEDVDRALKRIEEALSASDPWHTDPIWNLLDEERERLGLSTEAKV